MVSHRHHGGESRPFVIGLTGPIAAGKSSIAELLRRRGAHIIDADEVYHSLVAPGAPLLKSIADRFGSRVLTASGALDRAALARLVFNDPWALADLDRLTHPAVVADVRRRIAASTAPIVVIEAIKLVPSGLIEDVDSLWLVTADPEVRIARLKNRNGLDAASARSRVAAASDPLSEGVTPDITIDNSGDIDAASRAVAAAWHTLIEPVLRSARQGATHVEKA